MRPIWSHDHYDIVNPFTYQNRLSHFLSIHGNRHMWTNQRCCYTERLSRSCESHPDIRQHLRIHHNLLSQVVWTQHEMSTKIGWVLKQIVCWGSFTRLFRHLIAKRKTWCVVGWKDLKLKEFVSLVTTASEWTICIATDCLCVTIMSTGCAFIDICKKFNVVYHKNTNISFAFFWKPKLLTNIYIHSFLRINLPHRF